MTTIPTVDAYRRNPYRPDTVVDGWNTPEISVRGVSMRGHLHRFNGAPRQDEMVLTENNGRVVAVVADGVSSAIHSHVGSTAVARYAAAWLDTYRATPLGDLDFAELLMNASWSLVGEAARILGLDEPDANLAAEQFSTTIVVAVCEPIAPDSEDPYGGVRCLVSAVGDSSAWILTDGTFVALGHDKTASDGLTSNLTTALPEVPSDVTVLDEVIRAGETLLIGTDGFGDPLGDGNGAVGDLFRDVFAPGPPQPLHLAHALDFSRERFDDDRTLVSISVNPGADRDH